MQNAVKVGSGILFMLLSFGSLAFAQSKTSKANSSAPITQIAVTKIKVNNKVIPINTSNPKANLIFTHNENDITIYFSSRNYLPLDVYYKYRLSGYSQTWSPFTKQNFVRFANLPSGNYQFQLSVCELNGNCQATSSSFSFKIKSPFWLSEWFITIVISFFVLAISVLGYIWLRQVLFRSNLQKNLADLEYRALKAQMNPHFIFNAINAIQYYMLKNKSEEAVEYTGKFASLMRAVVENTGKTSISMAEEIQWLKLYLEMESQRFEGQFTYKIKYDPTINPENTLMPPMIIQTYVENAIWHGLLPKNEGKLEIKIFKEKSLLRIEVEDDGIGRDRSAAIKNNSTGKSKSKSLGMSIALERLRLANLHTGLKKPITIFDLTDDAGNPIGTRIVFYLPHEMDEGIQYTNRKFLRRRFLSSRKNKN